MEYAPSGLRLGPYAPPSDEGTGERGIREIDRDRGVNTHAPPIMAYLGTVLFCLGFPDQALARTKAAIAESRRRAHLPSLAVSLSDGVRLLSLVEDNPVLGEWVDQLVAVTTEQGFPWWGAQGTIYRGCLKVRNGDVTEGTDRGIADGYRRSSQRQDGSVWALPCPLHAIDGRHFAPTCLSDASVERAFREPRGHFELCR
jgi:hypothetical protein